MRLLEWQWKLYARHLAASTKPILLGPWQSEVGFELLYWIPFLNRFRQTYQIHRDRLITIGRGGSAQWYDTAGNADLYEFLPLATARTLSVQAAQQTGSLKQNTTADWERHVTALTATCLGIRHYHTISPSWMYQLLAPYWHGKEGLGWLNQRTLHAGAAHTPPLPPDLAAHLPARYVAMRWYVRPTWPLKEGVLLWTRQFVQAVATKIPVVIITSGLHADDHADMAVGEIPNVIHLKDLTEQTPLNNLAIQSAVIARASAYCGTYGGMAQGAMRWGVPTLALYDTFGQTAPGHYHLTQHLSLQTGVPFILARPKDVDRLMPAFLKGVTLPATGGRVPLVETGTTDLPLNSSGVVE